MHTTNLLCSLSMLAVMSQASAAEYCGTVNGQQMWQEIAGQTCADLMKPMHLSKEHLGTARTGQAINAIQGMGDFMQQRDDEAKQQESRRRLREELDDQQQKQKQATRNERNNQIFDEATAGMDDDWESRAQKVQDAPKSPSSNIKKK